MKCPNCGKEAINVNGKFVCLDCGVELTSADSNAHNNQDPAPQAQEDTISATLDNQAQAQDQEPATQPEIPENSLGATAAPQPETAAINREETPAVTTPDFPVSEEIKAQEDITKPVEEAFVNELKVSNEPTDTGSYDFTNTEESSTPEVKPEVSEPQSQPIDQVPQAKDVNQVPQPEVPAKDYFQPKSFDIKSESQDEVQQSVDQVTTEIAPESPVEQPVVTSEVNQDQPQPITTPADPVSIPEEVIDTNSEEPQEVQEPVGSGSNLDSLLNQYNNPTSGDYSPNVATTESTTISEQPINNVDNMQTTIPPVNSETEPQSQVGASAIPSIESVFGNDVKNDVTQPNGLNELKSTDNIGKRSKGKLWIIIVAILGGLLLISGVGFGIYYYFNTNNESLNSQVLSDIEASSLSEKVDSAMSSAQSISVSFDENLDFSELKKNENSLSTTHSNSGVWEVDPDGNAYVSNSINKSQNKRTYIDSESKTYIYNQDEKNYNEINGFQIINTPKVFNIQNRGIILYPNSVEKLTEYPNESSGGVEYKKIQINFQDTFVKDVLGTHDDVFLTSDFNEFNTDNLLTYIYLDQDNRIKEIDISGEIRVNSDNINGVISVTSKATYSYNKVMINAPGEETAQDSENDDVEEVAALPREIVSEIEQNEDSESSSQDSEEVVVDVRG